jgi:hypothetical protein
MDALQSTHETVSVTAVSLFHLLEFPRSLSPANVAAICSFFFRRPKILFTPLSTLQWSAAKWNKFPQTTQSLFRTQMSPIYDVMLAWVLRENIFG